MSFEGETEICGEKRIFGKCEIMAEIMILGA
jgi:hypothetical protein